MRVTVEPAWAKVGTEIVHSTYGTGTVARVAEYKGLPAVWIDFDRGFVRALDLGIASRVVRPRRRLFDRCTPPDPTERCDVCGGRPVFQVGAQRYCNDHTTSYDPKRP